MGLWGIYLPGSLSQLPEELDEKKSRKSHIAWIHYGVQIRLSSNEVASGLTIGGGLKPYHSKSVGNFILSAAFTFINFYPGNKILESDTVPEKDYFFKSDETSFCHFMHCWLICVLQDLIRW